MSKRMDMVVAREGRDGKTFYTKIGVAWPLERGGYRLVFEALPAGGLNRDGKFEVTALLFEPRDNDRPASTGNGSSTRNRNKQFAHELDRDQGGFGDELDDSVPF